MTEQEFKNYKIAVNWRHVTKSREIINKIRSGFLYRSVQKDIKEFLMLDSLVDILYEYNLPEDEENHENFFSPKEMKNIALKINHLTELRYNYDFIKN